MRPTPMAEGSATEPSHSASRTDICPDQQEKCPQRQSLWQALRRKWHGRCLCLTVLICACISVTFWCQLDRFNQVLINLQILDEKLFDVGEGSTCEEGVVLLPVACIVALYVGYLIECYHSTSRLILMYRSSCANVYSYVEQMRQAQPIIWWKAASYHHVRHARPVARCRDGTSYTSSQLVHERVTTHVSGSYFSYSACGVKDVSKRLVGLEQFPTTRIYLAKGFAFANERSAAEFDEQRSSFFRSNERFDHFLEIREGLDLAGVNFQEYMIAVGDPQHTPWYSNQLSFWIFSAVLLSWPMRILLEYNTAYVNYQAVKLFGVNYCGNNSGGNATPTGLSRTSTVDTLSNCMIAPSYSEVMLADRVYCLRSCSDSFGLDGSTMLPKHKAISSNGLALRASQVPYLVSHVSIEQQSPTAPCQSNKESRTETHYALGRAKESTEVKNCHPIDPPTYEEVIEDLNDVHTLDSPRQSIKSYWNHLLGLIRSNWSAHVSLRRSLTDKDFYRQFLAVQLIKKPWTSLGDISNNFITNV